MINRLMEKKRQEEGFTLIELLIVVIILGILAAVVVFGVSTFREDSVDNACATDRKSLETAAEAYRTKTGSYPADPAPVTTGSTTVDDDPIDVLVAAGYLKQRPSSTEYTLTVTGGTGAVSACP